MYESTIFLAHCARGIWPSGQQSHQLNLSREDSRRKISDVAFEALGERRCLVRYERPGSLDGLEGIVSLAFELELPASRKALGDRG